jgi:hypothetical protein
MGDSDNKIEGGEFVESEASILKCGLNVTY